ncbi:MAG: nuclear transport factor 2 family protein [Hyphomonadaceae bacterium]
MRRATCQSVGSAVAIEQRSKLTITQEREIEMPMGAVDAQSFAREWVKAWNDHDLEAILSHYTDDVEFHSPRIRTVAGRDADSIIGKAALHDYWGKALEQARDLYFAIDHVFTGSDAVTIVYTNHRQQSVAETFVFNDAGKVERSIAAYG